MRQDETMTIPHSVDRLRKDVKDALFSPDLCSEATVITVRRLLDLDRKPAETSEKITQRKAQPIQRQTAIVKSKRSQKNSQSFKVTSHEGSSGEALDSKDRCAFATELVNIVLQTLSVTRELPLIKDGVVKPCVIGQPSAGFPTNTRAKSRSSSSISSDGALRQRSTNDQNSTDENGNKVKKPASNPSTKSSITDCHGVAMVAECGELAFECLRQQPRGVGDSTWQLESGLIAFIGRLIACGLTDIATKQLQAMKRHLAICMGVTDRRDDSTTSTSTPNVAASLQAQENLADLIHFKQLTNRSDVLTHVINHQILVLKLALMRRRPTVVEALCEKLETSCTSSPINLLIRLAKLPGMADRASSQMEVVAQLILSLCQHSVGGIHLKPDNLKQQISAENCLQLQTVAFEAHVLWRSLARHRGNIESELLRPFQKCLALYTKTSSATAVNKYHSLATSYNLLTARIHAYRKEVSELQFTPGSVQMDILLQIGRAAQVAGLWEQAEKTAQELFEMRDLLDCSTVRRSVPILRLAAVSLYRPDSIWSRSNGRAILQQAANSFNFDQPSTVPDLVLLLHEFGNLRSAVLSYRTRSLSNELEQRLEDHCNLDQTCQAILNCNLRLVSKCLHLSEKERDITANLTLNQLRQNALEAVRPSIESILLCHKTQKIEKGSYWISLDAALQSCLSLLRHAQIIETKSTLTGGVGDEGRTSMCVKLSQFYWNLYVTSKAAEETSTTVVAILKRSCECLDERPYSEKRIAHLPLKLAKLGQLLETRKEYQEAQKALLQSIQTSIHCGALSEFGDIPKSPSSRLVWPDSTSFTLLCQTIERLLLLQARDESSTYIFYDDDDLDAQQRTLILEWQLRYLAKDSISTSLKSIRGNTIPHICQLLFDIYLHDTTPGRRWRVALLVLQLATEHSDKFNKQFVTKIADKFLQECVVPLDNTIEQWADLEHLRASLMVALAFQPSTDCTSLLKEALTIWTGLVDNQSSPRTLVIQQINDVDGWTEQLQQISDFYNMQCRPYLQISTLQLLLAVRSCHGVANKYTCGLIQIKLGLQYIQVGYMEEAGILLMKVRESFGDSIPDSEFSMAFHLAHVEYYMSIGNLEKCKEHFAEATQSGAFDENLLDSNSKCSLHTRVATVTRISQRLYTEVQFLYTTSPDARALLLAKRNVEILQHIWRTIEAHNQPRNITNSQKPRNAELDVEDVRKAMSELVIESESSKSAPNAREHYLNGSAFWQFAAIMYRSFLQVSALYYHYGMFQDAMHQLQQAQQLGEIFKANPVLASTLARKGDYNCRSGLLEEGSHDFEKAAQAFGSLDTSVELARYHLALGHSHHLTDQWLVELEDYKRAEEILDRMSSSAFINELLIQSRPAEPDGYNTSVVSLPKKEKQYNRKPRAKAASNREIPVKSDQATYGAVPSKSLTIGHKFGILRNEISRRKAESVLVQGDVRTSLDVASNTNLLSISLEDGAQQRTTMAKILTSAGLAELSLDAVFSMLSESIITFPAVATSTVRRTSSHAASNVSPSKKPHKGTLKRNHKLTNTKQETATHMLCQAVSSLSDLRSAAVTSYSNLALERMSVTFTNAAMLLCFVQPDVIGKIVYPALLAYLIDLPRSMASIRERAAVAVESAIRQKPKHLPDIEPQNLEYQHTSLSLFQSDMIDIIPETWTAISISLDETREHMYIVRYQAHQSPFLLRLRLNRRQAEDPNEESFTFSEAKEELQDIIKSSDVTVRTVLEHGDKMNEKGAKTKWWTEREALDERLKNLLVNIENIWLGGFRGILSQSQQDPSLLARFQQSFNNILDKHLPSRHNNRGRNEKRKVQLSPKVLELFVGLAYLTNGDDDIDDALTDLLYYVVDILQFNGECNAYDEIDFDAMIVETQDALQSYHEGIVAEKPTPTSQHTVLILDKQLHAFPWESMPCLESQSVSRVSSLYDLRERILFLKEQQQEQKSTPAVSNPSGIFISPLNGTYILNPSADLIKTQSRFQPCLSNLASANTWRGVIGRAPTEEEFAIGLKPSLPTSTDTSANMRNNNDILLYFGHGSGGQYIRPRRIKRLAYQQQDPECTKNFNTNTPSSPEPATSSKTIASPTCNTTLLFGCSSAALQTAGEFNNYGPPSAYLIAGAPAFLGCLWDVTDGDCDTFAAAVLEGWGLVPPGSCGGLDKAKGTGRRRGAGKAVSGGSQVAGGKGKGKGKPEDGGEVAAEDRGERWGELCLSEAAARARGKCYLKYLNGAAMVVYGVPVFVGGRGVGEGKVEGKGKGKGKGKGEA